MTSPDPFARCHVEDGVVFFPGGTVTAHVDREHLALKVFSERDPDPEDWDLASQLIAWTMGGLMDDYWDEGLQVFVVNIVPEAIPAYIPDSCPLLGKAATG